MLSWNIKSVKLLTSSYQKYRFFLCAPQNCVHCMEKMQVEFDYTGGCFYCSIWIFSLEISWKHLWRNLFAYNCFYLFQPVVLCHGRKDLNDQIMKEQRNVQHTGTSNGRDWFLTVYNLSGVHSKKGKRGGTHWYPASRSSGVRRRDLVLRENGVHIGIFLVWLMTSMCHNKVYR